MLTVEKFQGISNLTILADLHGLTLPGFLYNVSRLMHSTHLKKTTMGFGIYFLRDEKIEEP